MIDETSNDIVDETNDPGNGSGNGPKMKYCPNCGKLKPEASRYCPECGRDRDGKPAGGPQFIPNGAPVRPAYGGPQPQYRTAAAPVPANKRMGPAIAALIVSIANFIMFGSLFTFISLPAVIILTIIVFRRDLGGKPMALIAVVVSVISAVLFAFYVAIAVKLAPDIKYFADNGREIVENYDKYGEIPERYEKFRESKYDRLWDEMGYDDFDEFFSDVVDIYRRSVMKENKPSYSDRKDREKTTGSTGTVPSTTEAVTDYDHSGEDLVVLS